MNKSLLRIGEEDDGIFISQFLISSYLFMLMMQTIP